METQITLTPAMMSLVPIIAYLVGMIKGILETYTFYPKVKGFLPLAAILIGIGLSYLVGIENAPVAGIMEGIASIAGYEILKGKNPTPEQEQVNGK
jgi:hypothetical protein